MPVKNVTALNWYDGKENFIRILRLQKPQPFCFAKSAQNSWKMSLVLSSRPWNGTHKTRIRLNCCPDLDSGVAMFRHHQTLENHIGAVNCQIGDTLRLAIHYSKSNLLRLCLYQVGKMTISGWNSGQTCSWRNPKQTLYRVWCNFHLKWRREKH